ncbi:unnamed protein product [Prorocentrum cordatum]|uniref:Uncharacterized protein n=1 Tax=Prorocentrum cordatum TaxID=2364126 RepID=A0ABN9YFY9_9DINO|nr:unnamed protein product [Polarella glacialis]
MRSSVTEEDGAKQQEEWEVKTGQGALGQSGTRCRQSTVTCDASSGRTEAPHARRQEGEGELRHPELSGSKTASVELAWTKNSTRPRGAGRERRQDQGRIERE